MIEMILERPSIVAIAGLVVVLATLWTWLQSGNKLVIWVALALFLLFAGLTLTGYFVQTDKEQLVTWLDQTAQELESNQFDVVRKKFHPGGDSAVAMLESWENRLVFSYARIKRIHSIEFDGPSANLHAKVKMNVLVDVQFQGNEQKIPRYVELSLYRVNGQWLVAGLRHEEPTYGFKKHDE